MGRRASDAAMVLESGKKENMCPVLRSTAVIVCQLAWVDGWVYGRRDEWMDELGIWRRVCECVSMCMYMCVSVCVCECECECVCGVWASGRPGAHPFWDAPSLWSHAAGALEAAGWGLGGEEGAMVRASGTTRQAWEANV